MDFNTSLLTFTMPECPANNTNVHETLQILQLIVSLCVLMNVLYSVYGFCSDPLREVYEKRIAELEDEVSQLQTMRDEFKMENIDILDDVADLKRMAGSILNKYYATESVNKKRRREESDDSD